jgi:hypothetical protein
VDVDDLEVVYGIVTAWADWTFTKMNVNDKKILQVNHDAENGKQRYARSR